MLKTESTWPITLRVWCTANTCSWTKFSAARDWWANSSATRRYTTSISSSSPIKVIGVLHICILYRRNKSSHHFIQRTSCGSSRFSTNWTRSAKCLRPRWITFLEKYLPKFNYKHIFSIGNGRTKNVGNPQEDKSHHSHFEGILPILFLKLLKSYFYSLVLMNQVAERSSHDSGNYDATRLYGISRLFDTQFRFSEPSVPIVGKQTGHSPGN